MSVYERLEALNIALPKLTPPVAAFVPFRRSGNLIFLAGHIAKLDGQTWVGQLGANLTTDDRAWLDFAGLKTLKYVENESFCVFLFAPTSSGAYSRMFAQEYVVPEDPATGSSTGPLAVFMMRHHLISKAGARAS